MSVTQTLQDQNVSCPVCGSGTNFCYNVRDRLYGIKGEFGVRACAFCGCGVTVPVVSEDALPQYYAAEYYTHERVSGARATLQSIDLGRRFKRHRLNRLKPGRILEIGPGDYSFLDYMHARGWRATALDPDDVVVRQGFARGYNTISGTVPALSSGTFDVIVAWHSLEHSVDPKRDIAILARHLAEGGKLIIGVPDYGSAMARHFGPFWFDLEVPRHRVHFTIAGLRLLAQYAGLRVTTVRHWLSPYAAASSINYSRGRGKISPVTTAASMAMWPLCWAAEYFGAGDSVSIVAERSTT